MAKIAAVSTSLVLSLLVPAGCKKQPGGNETGGVAYYVIGTKDELTRRGIVEETGGSRFLFVLWKTDKSLRPARTLDPGAFTAIDTRQSTTILLPDSTKSYRIISRQDLSSLATSPDEKGNLHGTVRIAAPDRFWTASKFLIIVEN